MSSLNSISVEASALMVEPNFRLHSTDTLTQMLALLKNTSLPCFPVVDEHNALKGCVGWHHIINHLQSENNLNDEVGKYMQTTNLPVLHPSDAIPQNGFPDRNMTFYVCDHDGVLVGVILFSHLLSYYQSNSIALVEYEDLAQKYECILNHCEDSVILTDNKGKIRWANRKTLEMGSKLSPLNLSDVYEMEKTGYFFPSVVKLVLKEKRTKTIIQRDSNGNNVLVTGTPVLSDAGEVRWVITVSRDINDLLDKLESFTRIDDTADEGSIAKQFADKSRTAAVLYSELTKYRQEDAEDKKMIPSCNPIMQVIQQQAARIARVDSLVLLTGESGSGKDMFATTIHRNSPRKSGTFVRVNCGAIPETLIESELFGYEPGAFTGAARKGKIGLFELADKGTLFLDEIGELPYSLQVKLLTAIQEHTFFRVGGFEPVYVDVRIIAATNKNLEEMVAKGQFRQDLYYRLNVVPIEIPPLRKRKEDLPALILHFLKVFNEKYEQNRSLSSEVFRLLLNYDWPGNVREVENMMERLVVIGDGDIIYPYDLPANLGQTDSTEEIVTSCVQKNLSLSQAVKEFERKLIRDSYNRSKSTTKVAQVLGVDRSTILRKLK